MFYPSLDKVKTLSKDYNIIPITMEMFADMETPISIFKRFEKSKYSFLLESVEGNEKQAKYSFIGRNPFIVVKNINGKTVIEDRNGRIKEEKGNPIEALKKLMENYKGADLPELPRFNGGAVGFFGYDLIRYYENLPHIPEDDIKLPDCHFMFTDEVIAFNHFKQKINIIVNLHVNGNIEESYKNTTKRIEEIYREIVSIPIRGNLKGDLKTEKKALEIKSNITEERFCSNVLKAKEYIKNGDIFQVVLSQRLCVETDRDPFNVYRVLRVINPSPYMYYLKFDDYSIAGASPEMLVRVENGKVETCPIAGTRKRGKTEEEDDALEKDLLSDEKECAEHIMLVDLGRNDIGKVSEFGTVAVKNLMHIVRYSHVMHIVSNVEGTLKKDKTPFDALMAVLPAGTLSGAPKVRAMEIIDELETVKRGTYGGAIGYLSFNGNLDSCITIRTVVFKDGKGYIQAGGGIVADSVPVNEYEESLNKAKALIKALEEVGEIR